MNSGISTDFETGRIKTACSRSRLFPHVLNRSRAQPSARRHTPGPALAARAPAQVFHQARSDAVAHGPQQRIEALVQPWQRGRLAQVAQHAVRAAKAGEHHRVNALPGERAVAHAVQSLGRPRTRVTEPKSLSFNSEKPCEALLG